MALFVCIAYVEPENISSGEVQVATLSTVSHFVSLSWLVTVTWDVWRAEKAVTSREHQELTRAVSHSHVNCLPAAAPVPASLQPLSV